MAQLTSFNDPFTNQNAPNYHHPHHQFLNFDSHQRQQLEHMNYYVREPNGKRPFPREFEMDMEYVPRPKRRYDKISARLENFSISNDEPTPINLESSSDEDMDEFFSPELSQDFDQDIEESTSTPLVVEPDDEPAVAKKIRLDGNLQRYLEQYKHDPMHFLPKPEKLKGNEITLWQPTMLVSPKNDFNMSGRIQEIDDDEHNRINEALKARIIENEGMVDEEEADRNESTGVVDLNCASDHSDIGSSYSSQASSPVASSIQIADLDSDSPDSLTNGSVSDEEMMEFD